MNTDNLILRETDNLPLINKNDFLDNADFDGNFINIYNDFVSLQATDFVDAYNPSTNYQIGLYVVYDAKLWEAVDPSFTGVTPGTNTDYWIDVFPTILAHVKNSDLKLAEGTANEVTASEIRAFIDAGLTSTTNLSITTHTPDSLKINSSTGADITLFGSTVSLAGLLSSSDKIKLNSQSGTNTGDQTLISLGAEASANKAIDFTVLNHTLYPTVQAVETQITSLVPALVTASLGGSLVDTTTAQTVAGVKTFSDSPILSSETASTIAHFDGTKNVKSLPLATYPSLVELAHGKGVTSAIQTQIDSKQATLVSATNIKTVNGVSILGSGDLVIASGGLTNFVEALTTTAPNTTVHVDSITALASTANADFVVAPKGTGALLAQIPNNVSSGGNKRGANAVDWQTTRFSPAHVASGNFSTVLGGGLNTSSGDYSISGGYGNLASGLSALAIGSENSASGNISVALGYQNSATNTQSVAIGAQNTVSGVYSGAIGRGNTVSAIYSNALGYQNDITGGYCSSAFGYKASNSGMMCKASFGASGYGVGATQSAIVTLDLRTTNATATVLVIDSANSATPASDNQFTLPNNSLMRIKGSIQGKQSGSVNCAVWDIDAVLVRGTSAGTFAIVGTPTVTLITNVPAWGTPTLTANTTIGCLTATVIGATATNIQWAMNINSVETIYA